MRRITSLAFGIGSLFLASTHASAQNIVKNGSFEKPVYPSGPVWPGGKPDDWTSPSGDYEVWTNTIPGAYDGKAFMELDVYGNTSLFQDLATSMGQSYFLSFALANRPGESTSGIHAFWGGSSLATVFTFGGWTVYSRTVTATSATTRLEFAAAGPSNGYGDWLDDVCVTEIDADGTHGDCHADSGVAPEPATLALLASGMLGLGGVAGLRRRRPA